MLIFFVAIFSKPEDARKFVTDEAHYKFIGEFKLFDQAYIDNLTACLTLKITSPDAYEELLPIIDKYIRPSTKNEGLNHLYQECGSFLAVALEFYEEIAGRSALQAASQLTNYSFSTLKKSYFAQKERLSGKLNKTLPPTMFMAALYWTLHKKHARHDAIKPFVEDSKKSKNEIQKAVAAYLNFNERMADIYHLQIEQYLSKNSLRNLPAFARMCGAKFPIPKTERKSLTAYEILFLILIALVIETVPHLLTEFDSLADKELAELT